MKNTLILIVVTLLKINILFAGGLPSMKDIDLDSIKKSELFMHLTMSQDRNNGLEKENTALRKKNLELKKRIALLEQETQVRLEIEIEEDSTLNIATANNKDNSGIADTPRVEPDVYQPRIKEKQLTPEQALVKLKILYNDKKYVTKKDSMAWYYITQDSIKQEIMGTDDPLARAQYEFTCTRIAYLGVRTRYKKLQKVEIDKNLPKEKQAKVRERLKEAKTKTRDKKKELRKKARVLKGNILKIEREKKRGLDEEAKTDKLVNSG